MLIGFRMKGENRPYFGELIDMTHDGLDIAGIYPDTTIVGARKQHIDAIWYRAKWLTVESFTQQTNGYKGEKTYKNGGVER
jgi:hypothetical protein